MKIAIIYSGAMRSFDKCWANHKWHVLRHFPDAKLYCVTEDDEDAHKVSFLPEGATVRKVKQPPMVIPKGCPDEWTPGKPYMHEPYHISVDPRAVLGQLWMLRQAWALYEEAGEPADLIIRIRPDLWFHSFQLPASMGMDRIAHTPRWGKFGGCNDRFALLGSAVAPSYFKAFDEIPAMIAEGAPLHPETLVRYAMERNGFPVCDDMRAEFSTLRKTGEMRPPEITGSDLLDAAMR